MQLCKEHPIRYLIGGCKQHWRHRKSARLGGSGDEACVGH
jgi:hypothetical protein